MHHISKKHLLRDALVVVAFLGLVVGLRHHTIQPLKMTPMDHSLDQNLELEEEFFWGVHVG